ncbi:GNAT family N-acetyltransferase [Mesobacterium pallidum]|uniref:GNAT family N-acetyltransferase n=1 Tax=Mesobacterium pallidum TaxID=2872037 RepID=UPI001EE2D04B|nr:GNAT family N-acetyltransferase [Mesobacterium pallidum]
MPTQDRLYAAMEATWPAAAKQTLGPWTIRDGQGGGKRVSAATADGAWTPGDIAAAEAAMAKLGQPALFQVRGGEEALDAALAARGYVVVDPVTLYAIDVDDLLRDPMPGYVHYAVWEPLAIQRRIWEKGGIGPARWAVMDRVTGPKSALLTRRDMAPGGTAFVALDGDIAMIHAIEVLPEMRRKGMGALLMRKAALWARDHGAQTLALAVTRGNTGGNALYRGLGMTDVGAYHYRIKEEPR